MIVLVIAWLLIQLVSHSGMGDPLKALINQIISIAGIVLFILHCFGIHLPACLIAVGG